jgi:hypothetical protein
VSDQAVMTLCAEIGKPSNNTGSIETGVTFGYNVRWGEIADRKVSS